jgi:hypothetical protein
MSDVDELAKDMFNFRASADDGAIAFYDMGLRGGDSRVVKVRVIGQQRIWDGSTSLRVKVIEDPAVLDAPAARDMTFPAKEEHLQFILRKV